jgi:cytochrome P450
MTNNQPAATDEGAVASAAVGFDPFEAGFDAWPYDQYRRLREHDPVHWSELLCGWIVTRYDDVSAILKDRTMSSDLNKASSSAVVDLLRTRTRQHDGATTIVLTDDPEHARLRRLIQAPFTARNVDRIRESIIRRVDAAVGSVEKLGSMELISELAYPLPVSVFCEMLGIPDEAGPKFHGWTSAVARSLDLVITDEEYDACMVEVEEMEEYLGELADHKEVSPGDDILSSMLAAEVDGVGFTRDELIVNLVTLYVAGHEPTTALIGNGMAHLLARPDQLAALQADPSLVPAAVHELLRFDGPNQFVRRIALEPTTFSGANGPVHIDTGDVIYVAIGAANHDPERFGPDAGELRIDRPDASAHVQFGGGVHTCLGAHLARMQAEITLTALLSRLPDIASGGDVEWSGRTTLRSVSAVPITWPV